MQVQISDEAAANIERLVQSGSYGDAETALDAAVWLLVQSDATYHKDLRAKLESAAASLDAGRGTLLTRDLAERIKREGRERRRLGTA